jgi:CubicO group peptidase (beta-lactamase class C family)
MAILIALAMSGLSQAQTTMQTTLPDTPAGKQFDGWLAAVNSGNRDTLRQFITDNFAPPPTGALPVDRITGRHFAMFGDSQGLTLQKVLASTDNRMSVIVQAKNTGYATEIGMAVTPDAPNHILGFSFRGTEIPADLLPHTMLTDKEIADRIDSLINKLVEADKFSGVILIARDDKPIYARASGIGSRTWNMPNRIDTKFNIGSIGKMFTSVAIAQLVEQGKLSYDDALASILPDYPDKELAAKITVHHLLTHGSGISNPFEASTDSTIATFRKGFRTVKEYLPTTPVDILKFEPGTKVEYSNYGYILLGAVIEKSSGQDYYSYIREHIYKPTGMTNTDSYELDSEPPTLATGYMDAPGGARRSNIFDLPIKGIPAGLGYSTAEDLVKFAVALRNNTLLNASSLKTVWTGRVDYNRGKYGYGCQVSQYNGTRIIGHGGGWAGITDQFETYPDLGYTVVILTNIDSAPDPIAYKLREWLTQGR